MTTTAAAPPDALLACPHCGCASDLLAVEHVETLVRAMFTAAGDVTHQADVSEPEFLLDTLHWTDKREIVCRSCDTIDLTYDQLVPYLDVDQPIPYILAATPGGATS